MKRDYLFMMVLLCLTMCSIGFVSAAFSEPADVVDGSGQLNNVSDGMVATVPTPGSDESARNDQVGITLSPKSLATNPGKTVMFSAVGTDLPENAHFLWSTSDEAVGIIDASGLFTAVAAGDVLVTVTLESDPAVTAYATVAVSEPAPVDLEEDSPDVSVMSVAVPWSGLGTEADPYRIADAADLVALATQVNAGTNYTGEYFLVTTDIDLSSVCSEGEASWTPIGTVFTPFSGTFDGDNHVIENMYINIPSKPYRGLFGYAQNANFLNVVLTDVLIIASGDVVGSLVGHNSATDGSTTTISNCHVTKLVISSSGMFIGGLVGENQASGNSIASIINCSSSGSVTGSGTSSYYVGGLAGQNYADGGNASIINCFSTSRVSGSSSNIGGLAGGNYQNHGTASIINCYATGSVTSSKTEVGGLVGWNYANSGTTSIMNSYASGLVTSSSGSRVGGVVGSNTAIEGGTAAVIGSVALNPSVTASEDVGRIVGNNDGGTLENNYATSNLAGTGGTDVSPEDAASQTFYEGISWNFSNVWKMDETLGTYPVLQWQPSVSPVAASIIIITPASGGTFNISDSFTAEATVYNANGAVIPTAVITWNCSNSEVFAISGTDFTATAAGNVEITAICDDVTTSVPVVVLPPPVSPELPQVISTDADGKPVIDSNDENVTVDETTKMVEIIDPVSNVSLEVTYSDDMTVEDGNVTGTIANVTATYPAMPAVSDANNTKLANSTLAIVIDLGNSIRTDLPTITSQIYEDIKEVIEADEVDGRQYTVGLMLQADLENPVEFNKNVSKVTFTFGKISSEWISSFNGVEVIHYATNGTRHVLTNVLVADNGDGTSTITVESEYGFSDYVLAGYETTIEEIKNTLKDGTWSAEVAALISYSVAPEKLNALIAPNITNKAGATLRLPDVSAEMTYENETTAPLTISVNAEDGTLVYDTIPDEVSAVLVTFQGRVLGDVTGRGEPGMSDANAIAQYYAGNTQLDAVQLFYGDVTGRGDPGMSDANAIAQYYAGNVDAFYQ